MDAFEIFTALGAGAGGYAVKEAVLFLERNRLRRNKLNLNQQLKAIAEVYAVMAKIEDLPSVDRILLLELTNGGHKPMPGSRMYAKAIWVSVHDIAQRPDILERYDRVLVDEEYIRMVVKTQSQPAVMLKVREMPECLLKSLYISEGVIYSEVYHIYTDSKASATFIVSVATYQEDSALEAQQEKLKASVLSYINTMRTDFEFYRQLS